MQYLENLWWLTPAYFLSGCPIIYFRKLFGNFSEFKDNLFLFSSILHGSHNVELTETLPFYLLSFILIREKTLLKSASSSKFHKIFTKIKTCLLIDRKLRGSEILIINNSIHFSLKSNFKNFFPNNSVVTKLISSQKTIPIKSYEFQF